MKAIKLFLLFLLFCSACRNKSNSTNPDIKFERTKWDTKDDLGYSYRKQMANDLLNSYKWVGTKKDSLIKLLGEPDEIEDDTFMIYDYHQKPFGLFEFSDKSLVFELNADTTVKLARKN